MSWKPARVCPTPYRAGPGHIEATGRPQPGVMQTFSGALFAPIQFFDLQVPRLH